MKQIKRSLFILMGFILVTALTAFFQYSDIKKQEAPNLTLLFNGEEVNYHQATVHHTLLGFIDVPIYFEKDSNQTFQSQTILNTLVTPKDSCITIQHPDSNQTTVCDSSDLEFNENGTYGIKVQFDDSNIMYNFDFTVVVDHHPILTINTLNPSQGGLVLVTIDNLESDSTIEIENHFTPSAILQENHHATFYLPMAYRENAQVYPLTVTINGVPYSYELDVQSFSFREVHFTVASTVVSSTVGNQDAVNQYRDVIYPTYETYEPIVYWTESFQLPVDGARKSSEFGEMRFVNNAKTPTRHAGIDYAVACDTEVVASNAGKVEVAQFLTMIGNTMVIDHGLGLKTYYEHMNDLVVKAGDVVEKGQLIGHVGTTGYSTGCHLHFQAMVKNQSINPEELYTILEGH